MLELITVVLDFTSLYMYDAGICEYPTFGVHMLWHVVDNSLEEDWSQYTALWQWLLLQSIHHLLPFGICSSWSPWSTPGMGLLCHSTGAWLRRCLCGTISKALWWRGHTASFLPLPAVTHQLVSAFMFHRSALPWRRVWSQFTSHGLPAAAQLIWLWGAHTLFLSPFLKMGATRAIFHWLEILPVSRDVMDMEVRWGATPSANWFSTFWWNLNY